MPTTPAKVKDIIEVLSRLGPETPVLIQGTDGIPTSALAIDKTNVAPTWDGNSWFTLDPKDFDDYLPAGHIEAVLIEGRT